MTEPIQIVLIRLLIQIEPFYIVLVVVVGLIGNTISFGIFLFTKLHHKHSNFILSALALCDNGFLITLFFANINIFNYDLFNTFDIVCKFTVYFTLVNY
ncbi:growth hormone secretagogue receptor type 1-like [Brachionus plicatilis]|uniref:Growth hormone secretagogue receptor type 1-like n=1 Tax=Brachionus plicatilis TaxID=10195 RepID=A0A3M7PFI8_BRAPC|nr:growth hormone secretagogue receptor type 1-like [Brachionus plicatilis]